ncbi:CLUMA_CG018007, isoform A [Clunio marinus]|uniref:CLUMA_CG018007, isoform A n=1 Tax=Clunio marinus TaxID=568069 RepID=A0A1J1IYG6_9DIPT|nr:CLUMA_CG018007, isoform A [Clunio marinus]
MNFSPFTTSFANVNVNQFAKFTQNLATPNQVLSLVSGSDGNVQFLQTQPQMTSPATTMNPTQTYITLPITIPPSKPGDATQTFQIQVLNPNPVPQAPKFQMGQMQIPIHGLQQHGTTVLTVAYSPQEGEIVPNQMPDGGPVTVLAAIQPQDLQLLAQQNGLTQQHLQTSSQQQQTSDSDNDNQEKDRGRVNIKTEPTFWGQAPVTISAPNTLTTDLSEYFQSRNMNLQPYLKFNTDGMNIKKEMYSDALAQLQLSDNNNVISINNNYNADNSNTSMSGAGDTQDQSVEMDISQSTENGDEKIELDANGKVKKKRKIKKKPPKPKRPKPGQVHIATALDGTLLFCCPECQMAYPEKESLESHLAVHKIDRRYICDICGAGLKRKEHLERHKLGHNPERPYVCHICLKGFKRKEHLNLHAVIHSGHKTEICSECGKGFYRKDHLRKHIKSHLTKRAKEEAAHANHQESNKIDVSIKREKLSPSSSPGNNNQQTNEEIVPISSSLSIPHFNLPQEVTIHAIDSLKNTECNTKEKIGKFEMINQSLSALQNHSNYRNFLSNAVQILLLFCEDNDSNCRISAEENLNRIIRKAEKNQQIILIQIDLYHELKKNGNERSLRICLGLFAHYMRFIKHRRRKVYAQNLLPCILAIGKRKEPLVIETLAEFLKAFSQHLINCLTDGETMKLIELFLDNLSAECAIKRRCSAQNILTILQHSVKKDLLIKSIVLNLQESLGKNQTTSTTLGTLSLFRLLTSMLVESKEHHQKLLEILETCLNILKIETNHSIINANLEALTSLLSSAENCDELRELFTDDQKMLHKEMLLSRRSMSALMNIDSRKSSDTETLKLPDSYLQVPSIAASVMSTPNKSVTDFSDVEGDSFKSIDFDAEVTYSSSPSTVKNLIERGAETMSHKSTDSINSFFNSIATNTETVSKFFRKSSSDSPAHQSKSNEFMDDVSIGHLKDENIDIPDSQTLPETAEMALEDPPNNDDEVSEVFVESSSSIEQPARELFIGSIFDQSIVEYIVRVVTSKFLLDGIPKKLISDQIIRVSIKNLALSVVCECVKLKSDVLMMKLPKDFTDESMMVESLLSYLVDEDLRLEEEEKKRKNEMQVKDEEVANTSESFMEIKDDHFGECTTATFLDYFSPLSKSLDDQGLISLKNRIYEEKTKNREESAKKINRDLCQLLTRSEIVESSKLPLMETTLKMPEDKDCQFIVDILLYSSHTDPVLRSNVYMIIGNFLTDILRRNFDHQKFISRNEIAKDALEFKKLFQLMMKGLRDEIHTVVKQTLMAVEKLINLIISEMQENEVEELLDQLLLVFCNKYWLVQCKYSDVITKIDFKLLKHSIGAERFEVYQTQIIDQLFELLKDSDFRVRNHVSELLPTFLLNLTNKVDKKVTSSLKSFVNINLLNTFEAFYVNLKDQEACDESVELELTRFLYRMSNALMDLKDKNQYFGVIYALKILIRKFSPLKFRNAWKEFNILNVLLSFINKNSGIALDVSCQCDMLEVISSLIAANGITNHTIPDYNEFLLHLMRILNIFTHLLSNTKPLIVPKQKGKDIFTSSKELAIINSFGFFSNDHFYLKLYLMLKSSYESYRMTINQEAEVKLSQLLNVTFKSLQTLLELKKMRIDHVKLIDETVGYLIQIFPFQPQDCVVTIKVLLRFLFQKNFLTHANHLQLIRSSAEKHDEKFVFESFENFSTFDADESVRENSFESSIKQFDPLVIQGLRIFSKSPAKLQATVLDMLCQLLEFNVNYMQLDAKKVFVDFVMRQLEYLESGFVIDGDVLAPKIIHFLIYLTKLKDKKLTTIPKIINIIDNLLASTNPTVTTCGVEALLMLSMELFFRKTNVKGEPEVVEVHVKETNTQREVVISMMLKFMHVTKIQEHLVWILLKSRAFNFSIDENEIFQQIVMCVKDKKLFESQLIGIISKNILMESNNFGLILDAYWSLLDGEIDRSTIETCLMLQEQAIVKVEEFYLINHLKLHQMNHNQNEDESLENFLILHHKLLLRCLKEKNLKMIERLWKFLLFKKHPTVLQVFSVRIMNTKEIIDISCENLKVFDSSVKFLLSFDTTKKEISEIIARKEETKEAFDVSIQSLLSDDNRNEKEIAEMIKKQEDANQAFDNSIQLLLSTDRTKNKIVNEIQSHEKANRQKLMEIFYKNLFAKRNDINAWENDELMEFFKENERLECLLMFSQNILLDSLLEDQEISRIILKRLTVLDVPIDRVKYLLENVHEDCLMESLDYVIKETMKDSKFSRTLQFVMVKKLNSIRNEIVMGRQESLKFSEDSLDKIKSSTIMWKYPTFVQTIEEFVKFLKAKDNKDQLEINVNDLKEVIDESWFLSQAKTFISRSYNVAGKSEIAEMLLEIKSESKLITLLTSDDFNLKLLPTTLKVSFKKMLAQFQVDCIQINPHLNYMKVSPLLKISILILMKNLEKANDCDEEIVNLLAEVLSMFLRWIKKLHNISLMYVEAKVVEKFIGENLLKKSFFETILKFWKFLVQRLKTNKGATNTSILEVLEENRLWHEINQNNVEDVENLVTFIYNFLRDVFKNTDFVCRYQHPQVFDELSQDLESRIQIAKQIIFIAKLQEYYEDGELSNVVMSSKTRQNVVKFLEISRYLLRLDKLYQFAITPYEILLSYRSGDDLLIMQQEGSFKLKQIPIEYLNDSELLEFYIRRITRYGFTQRQQFEEVFMTLLVLLNQWNDMQDVEEQSYIKQLCLQTNVELIISCFCYPEIGFGGNLFFHLPRSEKIKMENIGLKKLHHVQNSLCCDLNVFYQPNLERINGHNNMIGCTSFEMNQFALNYTWQMIEMREEVASAGSILSRNVAYYHEKCGVDFKSALQLIYDVMTQMIDENPTLVLPQLVKLVDVLDNSEQFKWINRKMLSLYELIASEDTISHQHVVYLLCRSSAVLVPSLSELQQLQVIVNKYLGCTQIFVRNSALQGLLCLFESLCKTNTVMGGISDEMKLLRSCILNYTNKNGIVMESNISSSQHNKLIWSLNFYVIEMTSKFLSECDLLVDSVISANNVLKRTNDLNLFYLILNGLERLVILNSDKKMYREKIEKLSLDLMKMDNKLYSLGGLKLLVTCLYIGSLEQLENTEKSNGIVQDEPEIIMQSTEKIEILFTRIRVATIDEAKIYGKVLGQILKDLLPPNEILTKVVKELLIMSQSNCVCIATIIHQVFRSAIDSSYLVLLQEWLICSLQNFLTYPNNKKSIWFLSIIFLSSTLNQNLLKLFPILLDENLPINELYRIFLVSAKDFYEKLTEKQKYSFKEAFNNRIKSKEMSSSACSSTSPSNTTSYNNKLFHTLLQHI